MHEPNGSERRGGGCACLLFCVHLLSFIQHTANKCLATTLTGTAWETGTEVDAWWVRASQVSKTAEDGQPLGLGSFRITGVKNFMPTRQLALAFAILFKVGCNLQCEEDREGRGVSFCHPCTTHAPSPNYELE